MASKSLKISALLMLPSDTNQAKLMTHTVDTNQARGRAP